MKVADCTPEGVLHPSFFVPPAEAGSALKEQLIGPTESLP